MTDARTRLAWEIAASRPSPAFFGAHVVPGLDLRSHMQAVMMQRLPEAAVSFLNKGESHDYLDKVFEGGNLLESAEVIFLEDALARSSHRRRARLNHGRELLRRQGKTLVFVETRAGSPEALDDLRDLLATFRDIVDLRPRASENDHLWDMGSALGLGAIASELTTTRGATVIKAGIVHRKTGSQIYRCPMCGGVLRPADTTLRFFPAPQQSAEQVVPGYVCGCGETWPDPRFVRGAHTAAFKV